ncbi:MAG: hypothetical protein QM726_19360 [Chitinophagaceae bacterium]
MIKLFRFNILSDTNWETKVENAIDLLDGIQHYFEMRNYGKGLAGIVLVVMCRDPRLKFKQRKRFLKKNNYLYLDIMLDYSEMISTTDNFLKARIIVEKIKQELFPILANYNLNNVELAKLETDFNNFIRSKGLME